MSGEQRPYDQTSFGDDPLTHEDYAELDTSHDHEETAKWLGKAGLTPEQEAAEPVHDRGAELLANILETPVADVRRLGLTQEQANGYVDRVLGYYPQVNRIARLEERDGRSIRAKMRGKSDEEILAEDPDIATTDEHCRVRRNRLIRRMHGTDFPPERMRDGLSHFLTDEQQEIWESTPDGGGNGTPGLPNDEPPNHRVKGFLERLTGKPIPEDLTHHHALDVASDLMDEYIDGNPRTRRNTARQYVRFLHGEPDSDDDTKASSRRLNMLRGILGHPDFDQEALYDRLQSED